MNDTGTILNGIESILIGIRTIPIGTGTILNDMRRIKIDPEVTYSSG
jgi:hypothetical protein